MSHTVIHPSGWLPAKGYANGVLVKDGTLHIGGQIGWDGTKTFAIGGFIPQMKQALMNVRAIVEEAGGTVEDVTRLTWFVTDKKEYVAKQAEVGAAYREVFGRHFPAMSMIIVSALVEDEAMVEIEATAHLS